MTELLNKSYKLSRRIDDITVVAGKIDNMRFSDSQRDIADMAVECLIQVKHELEYELSKVQSIIKEAGNV